jgi:hypothetical protein
MLRSGRRWRNDAAPPRFRAHRICAVAKRLLHSSHAGRLGRGDYLKAKDVLLLLILTFGALLIHGYHPGAEDAEIYLPGVEKILHPELFPFGAQFFESHARLTLFPNLLAASVKLTHLSLDAALLVWHLASILLMLLACWQLSGKCFIDRIARWAGVGLVATLLTLPVAGTALYIFDQYVNPRNLAAFAAVFGIAYVLDGKYKWAGLWIAFSALVHPLMAVFAFSYGGLLVGMKRFRLHPAMLVALLPIGISFEQPSEAYRQASLYHPFHYIQNWQWYEWLGIVGPIPLLWLLARWAREKNLRNLDLACVALIIYDLVYFVAALIVSIPARFGSLARLQPMRSLHLLYILFVLFTGGFLGQCSLKNRATRWLLLFVPLCAGMFLAQRSLFADSSHVEWPGAPPKNSWAEAFVWIRENTPVEATFALDPLHMRIRGEDAQGFRAIAQRSMLADAIKDSGAVSMFPPLAEEWYQQVQEQRDWKGFRIEDFRRLQAKYGVTWVVLQTPGVVGLNCPFHNSAVLVCRLN